jgi:hypothetical protein
MNSSATDANTKKEEKIRFMVVYIRRFAQWRVELAGVPSAGDRTAGDRGGVSPKGFIYDDSFHGIRLSFNMIANRIFPIGSSGQSLGCSFRHAQKESVRDSFAVRMDNAGSSIVSLSDPVTPFTAFTGWIGNAASLFTSKTIGKAELIPSPSE